MDLFLSCIGLNTSVQFKLCTNAIFLQDNEHLCFLSGLEGDFKCSFLDKLGQWQLFITITNTETSSRGHMLDSLFVSDAF